MRVIPGPVVEGAFPPRKEHVGDDPHTPHVRTGGRLLTVHHLGRHELYRSLQLPDVNLITNSSQFLKRTKKAPLTWPDCPSS